MILVPHEDNTGIKPQNASKCDILYLHAHTYSSMKGKCENFHQIIKYEVRGIPKFSVTFLADPTISSNLHSRTERIYVR
jgi:hypothetical protein